MASVTMTYGTRLIFDCETAFDEQFISGVTYSTSTDHKKGSFSSSLLTDLGFSTGIVGTKAIPSIDLSGGTTVRFWIKSTKDVASGNLKLLLDNSANCASPVEEISLPALTESVWTLVDLTLASPASCSAIISIGLKMTTGLGVHYIYIDNIVLVTESKTFTNALAIRGFDDVDEVRFYPTISQKLINGSIRTVVKTFGRRITIDFGVVAAKSDRIFLLRWMLADTSRSVTYASETVGVELVNVDGYANDWLDGIHFSKAFVMVCDEQNTRLPSNLPTSWA